MIRFFRTYRVLLLTAISLAGLLFLLRWLELRFLVIGYSLEVYIGAIALLFMGIGVWLALKLAKPKTVVVEKEVFVPAAPFELNETAIRELGLSKRELEVLELLSAGLSNQEIAGRLFVSPNTVKTHASKLFEKLDVRRRTQAVEKAKRLRIIP